MSLENTSKLFQLFKKRLEDSFDVINKQIESRFAATWSFAKVLLQNVFHFVV